MKSAPKLPFALLVPEAGSVVVSCGSAVALTTIVGPTSLNSNCGERSMEADAVSASPSVAVVDELAPKLNAYLKSIGNVPTRSLRTTDD